LNKGQGAKTVLEGPGGDDLLVKLRGRVDIVVIEIKARLFELLGLPLFLPLSLIGKKVG